MDEVNIRIDKTEKGEEEVVLLAELGLGTISPERGVDDRGLKYVSVLPTCKMVMHMMEQAIFRHVDVEDAEEPNDVYNELRNYLKEYSKAYMLNALGIEHAPILRGENGNLVGFQRDVKINIVSDK